MKNPLICKSIYFAATIAVGTASLTSCSTDMGDAKKIGMTLFSAGLLGMAFKDDDDDDDRDAATYASAAATVVGGVIVTEAVILARRTANAEQRKVAEENGRKAYARMSVKRKAAMKKDSIRYIVVDTTRTRSSRGQKDVMIYDTEREKMKSNIAFDVEEAPEVGERVKFDRMITEYVGSER